MRPVLSALALALLTLAACDEDRRRTAAREVSEEVEPFVEELGPESAETPTPPAPPATITAAETTAAIEAAGAVTALPVSAATGVIDRWIETLAGNLYVDDSDLLVEDLRQLRAQLAKPSIDGGEVGDILERLARETEQAGESADDASVLRLAEWLEEAGEALD